MIRGPVDSTAEVRRFAQVRAAWVDLSHAPDERDDRIRRRCGPQCRGIRRIEVFDLPKTISGKIRRIELRQREERIARGEESAHEWRDDQIRDAPIEGEAGS